jgi:hypothetical protein
VSKVIAVCCVRVDALAEGVAMKKLVRRIRDQFAEVCQLLDIEDYVRAEHKATQRALLLINNSYIGRDQISETNKSDLYLCADVVAGAPATIDNASLKILQSDTSYRSDRKILFGKQSTISLEDAIKDQKKRLGKLVFVLIGRLDKTLNADVDVANNAFTHLHYVPNLSVECTVDAGAKTISTRTLGDLGGISHAIEKKTGVAPTADQYRALAAAMDRLENEAVVKVRSAVTSRRNLPSSLLGELTASLKDQRERYAKAIARYRSTKSEDDYHHVLRIAYNFSSDALRVIHLLVCVSDLKPIVFWTAIAAHVRVAKAFESLPWLSTGRKASLRGYQEIIGNARNRAFHSFFAFNRTLDVEVDGVSLRATHLRLFRPYKKTRDQSEAFRYEDQDLVDVLVGFTRAPERLVELAFLEANVSVMKATEELANDMAEALFALRV